METENNAPVRRRKRRSGKRTQPRQDIQYTQPRPFYRNRLLMQLLTVAAVVLAITIGTSIFFKVDTVLIIGAEKYTAWDVAQASGIETGDSLLFFGRGKAASRIKSALPYVGTVRFEVSLPGTVNIIIEEKTVAYVLEADDGSLWKMTADGMIVEQAQAQTGATIAGVILRDPAVGQKAVASETDREGELATGAEHLQAAVDILSLLEYWGLFSDVAVIDVTDLYALRLYCGDAYRVELGDRTDMNDKIYAVKAAMLQLEDGSSAVLKLFYEDEIWQVQCNPWTER